MATLHDGAPVAATASYDTFTSPASPVSPCQPVHQKWMSMVDDVVSPINQVHETSQIPWLWYYLLWKTGLAVLASFVIFWIEYPRQSHSATHFWYDCLFMTTSATTATGLNSVDHSRWLFSSKVVLLCCVQLASSSLINLVVPAIRLYYLSKLIPRDQRNYSFIFDEGCPQHHVGQWLVEYQALWLLIGIVLWYPQSLS